MNEKMETNKYIGFLTNILKQRKEDTILEMNAKNGDLSISLAKVFKTVISVVNNSSFYSPGVRDKIKNNNISNVNVINTNDMISTLVNNINNFKYLYLDNMIEDEEVDFDILKEKHNGLEKRFLLYICDDSIQTFILEKEEIKEVVEDEVLEEDVIKDDDIEEKEVKSEEVVNEEAGDEEGVEEKTKKNNNNTKRKRRSIKRTN